MSVIPASSSPFLIPYREILNVIAEDYKVNFKLLSDVHIVFSKLGFKYEGFLSNLSRLRNEILLKDMLMSEILTKPETSAEFLYSNERDEM